jgi:hypothetical protein
MVSSIKSTVLLICQILSIVTCRKLAATAIIDSKILKQKHYANFESGIKNKVGGLTHIKNQNQAKNNYGSSAITRKIIWCPLLLRM